MSANPAGFYVAIPEHLELSIRNRSIHGLYCLIASLACCLDIGSPFEDSFLEFDDDAIIDALSEADKVAFLRWVADLIADVHSQRQQADGQP